MTRKQKQNIAREIFLCELTQRNSFAPEEKKIDSANRITTLTNQIMQSEDGINSLMEIDAYVHQLMEKSKYFK